MPSFLVQIFRLRPGLLLALALYLVALHAQAQADKKPKPYPGDPVYIEVEQMPEFPGGTASLPAYLGSQVVIPAKLKKEGIEGLAVLSFVVNKKGKIEFIEILKSLHPDMDKELVRVIQNMPTWKPGYQNGKKVKVKYTVPFRINIT